MPTPRTGQAEFAENQNATPPAPDEREQEVVRQLESLVTSSMVIVCVGSEMQSDDGAGPLVAKKLADKIPWPLFNALNAPESFVMKVVARKPAAVLLIDAMDFGADPGTVRLFQPQEVTGQGPSTHGPAPVAFLKILQLMHPCQCAILGIQPQSVEFGKPMNPAVHAAAERVAQALQRLARNPGT